MDPPSAFRLADRLVDPACNEIAGVRVDSKAMDVLVQLARVAPSVLSNEELLDRVWPDVIVVDNVLHQAVRRLRARLGDRARTPRFIECVPRRGYRLLTPPEPVLAVAAPEDRKRPPLLAVLPLEVTGQDAELRAFADGLSDELLQTVARSTGVRVLGRTSSFGFRSEGRADGALGATHLLGGRLRRGGNRLRVFVELVEAGAHATLWSRTFELPLAELFAMQDRIARGIAHALRVAFRPARRIAPADPVALDLYLRARTGPLTFVGGQDTTLLEAAVARDPDLAPAQAALALSLATEMPACGEHAAGPPAETLRARRAAARRAAARALELDPEAALAHAALAALEPLTWAFEVARRHLDRALAAMPSEPSVHLRISRWCRSVGREAEALQVMAQAFVLDPLDPSVANEYATLLWTAGRVTEARPIFERNRARWPGLDYVVVNPLLIAAWSEDWSWADAQETELRRHGPDNAFVRQKLAHVERLRAGSGIAAEAALQTVRAALAETGTVPLLSVAEAAFLGRWEEAVEAVEAASFDHLAHPDGRLLEGDPGLHYVHALGARMPAASEPRFLRLCARLGLCACWADTGRWPDRATGREADFERAVRAAARAFEHSGTGRGMGRPSLLAPSA